MDTLVCDSPYNTYSPPRCRQNSDNTDWDFCSHDHIHCQEGEGDCDDDSECENGLICKQPCPYGLANQDCCLPGDNSTLYGTSFTSYLSAEQCRVENDTRYAGYDYVMPDGKLKCSSDIKTTCTQRSPVPDVDICKSFCHANDYFTWISSKKECFCKKSDSGKGHQSGSVSGATKCHGKIC